MIGRLLSTVLGLAAPGEAIEARLSAVSSGLSFAIARPASLSGLGAEALLDPSYGPEGEWPDAPALGLGFALRLIGNTAKATKSQFEIEPERFVLLMPVSADESEASEFGLDLDPRTG